MNFLGVRLGHRGEQERDRLLAAARTQQPTYAHIGSTLASAPRDPTRIREGHLDVGRGADAFRRARQGLRTWVTHSGINAAVEPAQQSVELGATVLVVLRVGPVHVIAPNRVVAVIDEPTRFAYAYGTLPGHPECGEESFVVELLDDEVVRATIRVHARGATLAARAAAPIVRQLQAVALRRYLCALAAYVKTGDS